MLCTILESEYIKKRTTLQALTGVTQSKIGDVYLASERSERDSIRVDNAKSGICYMCMWDGTYAL